MKYAVSVFAAGLCTLAVSCFGDVVLFDEPQVGNYDDIGAKNPVALPAAIINTCSFNNPYSGFVCVEASGTGLVGTTGSKVSMTFAQGWIDPTQFAAFTYWIRQKNVNAGHIDIHWFDVSGQVGNKAAVVDGRYGFSKTNITTYQQVTIPMSAFAFPAGRYLQRVTFDVVERNSGFYIDSVVLVGNGVVQYPSPWPTPTPAP